MKDPSDWKTCPTCNESLEGEKIPEKYRNSYGNHTHFSKIIGIEYASGEPESYDGISEYTCPHCKTRWGRWTGKELAKGEVEKRFGR